MSAPIGQKIPNSKKKEHDVLCLVIVFKMKTPHRLSGSTRGFAYVWNGCLQLFDLPMERGPGVIRIEAMALFADHVVETVGNACGGEGDLRYLQAGLCARNGEDIVRNAVDNDEGAGRNQLAKLTHIKIFCDMGT